MQDIWILSPCCAIYIKCLKVFDYLTEEKCQHFSVGQLFEQEIKDML